jgi:hypothetical protein
MKTKKNKIIMKDFIAYSCCGNFKSYKDYDDEEEKWKRKKEKLEKKIGEDEMANKTKLLMEEGKRKEDRGKRMK